MALVSGSGAGGSKTPKKKVVPVQPRGMPEMSVTKNLHPRAKATPKNKITTAVKVGRSGPVKPRKSLPGYKVPKKMLTGMTKAQYAKIFAEDMAREQARLLVIDYNRRHPKAPKVVPASDWNTAKAYVHDSGNPLKF
jgi:hypothetical protein